MIVDRHVRPIPIATLAKNGAELVSTYLAQPGEQEGLAAVAVHLAHDDTHRTLNDLFGQRRIVIDAGQCKTVETGKIFFEKRVERGPVTGCDLLRECAVLLDLWQLRAQPIPVLRSWCRLMLEVTTPNILRTPSYRLVIVTPSFVPSIQRLQPVTFMTGRAARSGR